MYRKKQAVRKKNADLLKKIDSINSSNLPLFKLTALLTNIYINNLQVSETINIAK